jgi:hypothetical protein
MNPNVEQHPAERIYDEYNQVYKRAGYPVITFASIIIVMFGLFTTIWALPFPHIAFLGKYNGYINWASFLIAGMIYYYLKLSPMISYLILFMLFGLSYAVIQLEQWQKAGGPHLWLLGAVISVIGLAGQLFVLNKAKPDNYIQLLLKAPTWLMITVLNSIGFKIK